MVMPKPTEAEVNIDFAKIFFTQACEAHQKGDINAFEAARYLVVLHMGLTVAQVTQPKRAAA